MSSSPPSSSVERLGLHLSRVAERFVPDPFVLALLLTALVGTFALSQLPPAEVVSAWMGGFTNTPLLAFALQMCLVLVTGHALALSPPLQRLVAALARLPKTSRGATGIVAFVACAAAVIHWGLGAIVGAFLAREMGRHAKKTGLSIHYPMLGAAAYAGMAVWHGGLSGSAPLKVAEDGHFAAEIAGVLSIQDTLFGTLNLIVTGGLLALIPLVLMAMTPAGGDGSDVPFEDGPVERTETDKRTRGEKLFAWLAGSIGLVCVLFAWASGSARFDLNLMNFLFLFSGLVLQGSVAAYSRAVTEGAKGAGAIVIQFPFYFGILGLMKAAGLVTALSEGLVGWATATTFPTFAFLSAGITNLFVPSGGGQWAVQGEVLLSAAHRLGVAPETAVMAFSYGDAWTNMLQPFWALPLLGIMGLKAKQIVGYTAVVFMVMAIFVPLVLTLLG